VVGIIKSNTSKALRIKFDFIRDRYPGASAVWSKGYFVSTVGLDEGVIRNYIRHQEKDDLGQAQLALV
jgi:putative transposase